MRDLLRSTGLASLAIGIGLLCLYSVHTLEHDVVKMRKSRATQPPALHLMKVILRPTPGSMNFCTRHEQTLSSIDDVFRHFVSGRLRDFSIRSSPVHTSMEKEKSTGPLTALAHHKW